MNRTRFLAWFVVAIFSAHLNTLAQPDLLYSQMAVGAAGGLSIETIVTLTNSGSATYDGTFHFWTGAGVAWNPMVGGQPIADGQLAVSLEPLETVSLVFTGTELMAGSGILSGEEDAPGLLEGTLTYLLRSGGDIVDSVGVAPAIGLSRATIPFEEFATIGLALANAEPTAITVRLVLRDELGVPVETVSVKLAGNAHSSRFLHEYFSADTVVRGRVDIESDAMVYGTAVTLIAGQISTLSLRPSSVLYDVRALADDGTTTLGTLSLQAGDAFVRGFLELTVEDGVPLAPPARTPVVGRLIDGDLRLTFFIGGPAFDGDSMVVDVVFSDFSFDQSSVSAQFTELFLSELSISMGTFEFTRKE